MTDKHAKNGTSKYVLERCASINEYYDIAFKVCILIFGLNVDLCLLAVEQVRKCSGDIWVYLIVGSSRVDNVRLLYVLSVRPLVSASCMLLAKHTARLLPRLLALAALTHANICRGWTCCASQQSFPLCFYRSVTCASATVDEDAQKRKSSIQVEM